MKKMTSAYANKLIRKLNEDKEFWRTKEKEECLYVAALNEEPMIPDYDYEDVARKISDIDMKIMKIKHAVNVSNCTNEIKIGRKKFTVDMILVRMAQLNKRRTVLDEMRKQQPKTRMSSGYFNTGNTSPEYRYINYDLELIKKEYEVIDAEVSAMQIALDKYNQTVEFEVDI